MPADRNRRHDEPMGLTEAELAKEAGEALPERAAMSTLSVAGLDAAAGTAEAVSDGVTETAAATTEQVEAPAEAPVATTTEAPRRRLRR